MFYEIHQSTWYIVDRLITELQCDGIKVVNNMYDKNYLPLNQQEPNLWTKWQNKMKLEIKCLQDNM